MFGPEEFERTTAEYKRRYSLEEKKPIAEQNLKDIRCWFFKESDKQKILEQDQELKLDAENDVKNMTRTPDEIKQLRDAEIEEALCDHLLSMLNQ
jgi:hypothetical protein